MIVRPSTFLEVAAAPEWPALLAEYAAESAIAGMPAPLCNRDLYAALCDAGRLHVFGAWQGHALAGFIFVLATPLPHYSVTSAVSESFFVAEAYRPTGAGLKLLRVAEAKALDLGAPGLLVSAPYGGRLFDVLPRRGYVETSRIFFKSAADMAPLPEIVRPVASIPAMTSAEVERVSRLEAKSLEQPQVNLPVDHFLHAGIYARTVLVPAGVMITGALIKVPTVLIIRGDAIAYVGEESHRLTGYAVLPAAAHRKQAFVAVEDTHLTMIFPTGAATVEEAEAQFTDEVDRLQSRQEAACQA